MAFTKKEIEAMSQIFVTNVKFDAAMRTIDKRFDQLAAGQDKILGELEKAREDRIFALAKDREQDSGLGDLAKRLAAVEQKV